MAGYGTDPNEPNPKTGPSLPGGGITTPSGNGGDVTGGGTGYPGTGGGGGGGGGTATPAAVTGNGFDPQNIIMGADGHFYAFRRSFNGQTYGYETVDIGDGSDLATMSATTGIPTGALQTQIQEAKNNAAKVQAGTYGKILGVGTDGTVIVQAPDGKIQRVDQATAEGMGIQPEEILRAQADLGQVQKTLTKMGQYTVVGMGTNGTLTVEDFYGNRSDVDAAHLPPGVSLSDFQNAQTNYINNTRTATQSQNYKVVGTNPDGSVRVEDYFGNQMNVTPSADGSLIDTKTGQPLKGVVASDVQQALQRQTELNFNGQSVAQTFGFGVPAVLPGAFTSPAAPAPPTHSLGQYGSGSGDGEGGVGGGLASGAMTPPPPATPAPTPAYPTPPVAAGTPAPAPVAPAPAPAYNPAQYGAPQGTGTPTALPPAAAAPPAYPAAPTAPATAPAPTPTPTPVPTYKPPAQSYPTAGGVNLAPGASATSETGGGAMGGLNAQYQAAAATYNATGTSSGNQGGLAMNPGGTEEPGTHQPPSGMTPTPAAGTGTTPTGTNALTAQQLALLTAARQNYYNLGRTAQSQQTAAIAGQSRSGEGTGFGSIQQRQVMAGQQ